MKNEERAGAVNRIGIGSAVCILGFAFMFPGCIAVQQPSPPPAPPASLVAADRDLSSNLPDNAIADAQSYLRGNPNGSQAALAWYLQGRGWEQKIAADQSQMDQDLFQENSCYLQALQLSPPPSLEGDIRASLSNVLFQQDKFADSIYQAEHAMPLVGSSQTRSYLLLGIGESQQRLGRFTDADMTFNKVQRLYPNTAVAEAARDHEGQTRFYVQLATYNNELQADQAMNLLAGSGEIASKMVNRQGLSIVHAGPYSTYTDAKREKDKLIKNFPLATIVP